MSSGAAPSQAHGRRSPSAGATELESAAKPGPNISCVPERAFAGAEGFGNALACLARDVVAAVTRAVSGGPTLAKKLMTLERVEKMAGPANDAVMRNGKLIQRRVNEERGICSRRSTALRIASNGGILIAAPDPASNGAAAVNRKSSGDKAYLDRGDRGLRPGGAAHLECNAMTPLLLGDRYAPMA